MPSRRFIVLLIGVCLSGGLQAHAQEPVIESHVIDNESISPRTYWTDQRIREAKPMPLPSDGQRDVAGATGDNCPTGLLFKADLSRQPYASAGRLYFFDGSVDRYCTAEFTEGGWTLLTAAHCVRNRGGQWYSRFMFMQSYDEGRGRRVELSLVATWQQYWKPKVSRAFDYAFFRTSSYSSRDWLQLGTPDSHPFWLAIGYSTNDPHKGEKLVQIMGPKGPGLEPGVIQMLGNPTDGGSGGAWIANPGMCSSAGNVAVGLTASRNGDNCELNSPLFNKETRTLLNYVRQRPRPGRV